MDINRTLVSLLAVPLLVFGLSANAAQIKIATMVPENTEWMKQMKAAGKVIDERTGGRVKLKFYGGGIMGNESQVLGKVRFGQLNGGTFAPTDFMSQYSAVNVYGLPFVFSSWDEMRYVREQMDAELERGFHDLNFVTYGFVGSFSMVLSKEPISTHKAMRGKRVWLPQGDDISYEAMKRLELSPVPKPVTDVLSGLQTGLLDIAAIPPEVAVALQWHTKVKFYTDMPVLYAMSFLAIDKRTIDKLEPADREVLDEELRKVYRKIDANAAAESANAVAALETIGIERVEPAEGQLAELQSIMSEANREMAKEGVVPIEVFDKMMGYVEDYRNRQAAAAK